MERKELQEFIYFLTRSKQLSRAQQKKRDYLLARDSVQSNEDLTKNEANKCNANSNKVFRLLSAIDTAQFLSLFNDPMGFKYLTHDFDRINDGRPQSLDDLHKQATRLLEQREFVIPSSLWTPINNYLHGGKEWIDTFGKSHDSFILEEKWKEWSVQNMMHPINNPEFASEILSFRSTVRLVPPLLKDICYEAKKGLLLKIEEEGTEKADFYTNTYVLYNVIKRIFAMMNRRVDKHPNVKVSYKRSSDSIGRMVRKILITQFGSYALNPIDEVKGRISVDSEAGDFGSIRKALNGYCLWQVETMWDGKPLRWNILKTDEMNETEDIDIKSVEGFTHIFTFYIL